MEIPHIIFDKGKINIQKDNSVKPIPKENVTGGVISELIKVDLLLDKIRRWALIGFIGLIVIYAAFRLIKILFGG